MPVAERLWNILETSSKISQAGGGLVGGEGDGRERKHPWVQAIHPAGTGEPAMWQGWVGPKGRSRDTQGWASAGEAGSAPHGLGGQWWRCARSPPLLTCSAGSRRAEH